MNVRRLKENDEQQLDDRAGNRRYYQRSNKQTKWIWTSWDDRIWWLDKGLNVIKHKTKMTIITCLKILHKDELEEDDDQDRKLWRRLNLVDWLTCKSGKQSVVFLTLICFLCECFFGITDWRDFVPWKLMHHLVFYYALV